MVSRVSCILTTFNGATRGFLSEAIESVLLQDYPHYELLLIDDGSTDDTASVCKKYTQDQRVRYCYQENTGLAGARKFGVEQSKEDYICFLDDDDLWEPRKLSEQIMFFENTKDPKAGMVYTAAKIIDASGKVKGVRYQSAAGNIYDDLIYRGNLITAPSSVMIKKHVMAEVGNVNPDMKSLEDLELWLRIAEKFSIYSLRDALIMYRVHERTITAGSYQREEQYEKELYKRILIKYKNLDREKVLANMYFRFAIRHFSLSHFAKVRYFMKKSSQYDALSIYQKLVYCLSYFPHMCEILKKARQCLQLQRYKITKR
jgi:glycosyltransferase involved in cell wall biosynthesis